jgi:integrase
MPKCALTQKFVTECTCSSGVKKVEFFDEKQKGLVLEVRQSGGKTFYLRMADKRRKVRYYRLGYANDINLSQARDLCQSLRTQIILGIDPKEEQANCQAMPTLLEVYTNHYLPYVQSYKRSWRIDVSVFQTHILPALGTKYLDDITRADITQLHQAVKAAGKAPATANRILIILRFMFNLVMEKWQLPGVRENPASRIPLFQENNKRERYLTEQEIKRLHDAVQQTNNPWFPEMIGLLLVTGVRKSELLNAKWQDVNFSERIWRIPMTKSGYARHVPLNDTALSIFLTTRKVGSHGTFVFPNPKTNKPYTQISTVWKRVRKIAALPDLRLHDLRHSFASLLVNSGRTLYEVQRLLGHSQARTTQRYAHLSHDTLLEATNVAGERVSTLWSCEISEPHQPMDVKEVIQPNETRIQTNSGRLSTL